MPLFEAHRKDIEMRTNISYRFATLFVVAAIGCGGTESEVETKANEIIGNLIKAGYSIQSIRVTEEHKVYLADEGTPISLHASRERAARIDALSELGIADIETTEAMSSDASLSSTCPGECVSGQVEITGCAAFGCGVPPFLGCCQWIGRICVACQWEPFGE